MTVQGIISFLKMLYVLILNISYQKYLDRLPAFLTSDDFIRSKEIITTKLIFIFFKCEIYNSQFDTIRNFLSNFNVFKRLF